MTTIINPVRQTEHNETRPYCRTTFETSEGPVQNSYVCGQSLFTSLQMWKVLRQKREFPRKG